MSLHPQEPPSVPEETIRVARAAFPKGSLCLCIADELGSIYTNGQFTALFPRRGKHAEAPGRLALATVLQFVEGLSDRQAADAVRTPTARLHAWLTGLQAGRTLATNGPLLGLTVEGHSPGADLSVPAGKAELAYKGFLRSIVPMDHLELVMNGRVVRTIVGGRTVYEHVA